MLTSNKIFFSALILSTTLHTAVFIKSPQFSLFIAPRNKPMKIAYVKDSQLPVEIEKKLIDRKNPLSRPSIKVADKQSLPQPLKDREALLAQSKRLISQEPALKPLSIKPDIIAVKKRVTLPPLDIAKMNNPSYIGYYQLVREKIRRAAYQNYARTEEGEAYLTFVITQEGFLRDVKLIPEKSSPSYYLRDISLRSVRGASPFPPFPRELNYPQLSFNVIISYEIE
jgi:TonB family protein